MTPPRPRVRTQRPVISPGDQLRGHVTAGCHKRVSRKHFEGRVSSQLAAHEVVPRSRKSCNRKSKNCQERPSKWAHLIESFEFSPWQLGCLTNGEKELEKYAWMDDLVCLDDFTGDRCGHDRISRSRLAQDDECYLCIAPDNLVVNSRGSRQGQLNPRSSAA